MDGVWDQPTAINLVSERIALGPLRDELAPLYNRWRNDFWMQRTFGMEMRPVSLDVTQEQLQAQARSESTYNFTIYRHDTWEPIGRTNLQEIDHYHGTAEFGIMIGTPSLRNQGYGTETARLMLFYAFRVLNLHSVSLMVDGANPGGQRAYEKAGFTVAGRLREYVVVDNERVDLIHMECLARDFTPSPGIGWGAPRSTKPPRPSSSDG